MKFVQAKLLLLASALFVASSCDCIKKPAKVEKTVEVVEEVAANEVENTLVADASDSMSSEVKPEGLATTGVSEDKPADVTPTTTEEPKVESTPAEVTSTPAPESTPASTDAMEVK